MKATPCKLITWTRWGHVCAPLTFPSVAKAKEEARFMVREGYAFGYKIVPRQGEAPKASK